MLFHQCFYITFRQSHCAHSWIVLIQLKMQELHYEIIKVCNIMRSWQMCKVLHFYYGLLPFVNKIKVLFTIHIFKIEVSSFNSALQQADQKGQVTVYKFHQYLVIIVQTGHMYTNHRDNHTIFTFVHTVISKITWETALLYWRVIPNAAIWLGLIIMKLLMSWLGYVCNLSNYL